MITDKEGKRICAKQNMKHRHSIATVIIFVLLLGSVAIAFWLLPDRDFSARENRALQTLPRFDAEKLFSGELSRAYNDYYADQFPVRDLFVTVKGALELLSGKGENNGILIGRGSQLAKRLFDTARADKNAATDSDVIDAAHLQNAADGINRATRNAEVPLVVLLTGRTADVATSAFLYPAAESDKMLATLRESVEDNARYLDLVPTYRTLYVDGEYVYYRTDHHWTTLGAYYTYCEIMKSLGKKDRIIPIDEFEIEQVDNYSGTTQSKANFPIYKKDVLEIWHLPDDNEYTVIADGKDLGGFYNRKFLETTDKYSVFLDSTHNVTEIKKEGENRETLLIAKDSFANCLIPFLAREYNIIALNLNTFTTLSSFAEYYGADAVLICYNTENLITTPHLSKVR